MKWLVTGLLLVLAASGPVHADDTVKLAPRSPSALPLPYAPPPPPMPESVVACAADVRPCPDGSRVSRNPVNDCSFNACPAKPSL